MLLNLSNHPISRWSDEQVAVAKQLFGEIEDYPFPQIDPQWDAAQVEEFSNEILNDIIHRYGYKDVTVHLMGELTFCFALLKKLQHRGIRCVASTTERITEEQGKGTIIKQFRFVRFREYL
jgi:hypothetical protein